jgi:hypothetical protein
MLLKYNCHINVVVCSGIRMIKYLHKYVFKGNDRLKVQLAPVNRAQQPGGRPRRNEIAIFMKGRYDLLYYLSSISK